MKLTLAGHRYTDVLIAGDDGIAFYGHQDLGGKPMGHFLQGIAFKQVVCSEKAIDKNNTALSIFAVSDRNELYYIGASRQTKPVAKFEFPASALPIRKDVTRISTQFSKVRGTSELLYLGNGQSELRHLCRDHDSSLWAESSIDVPNKGATNTQQAFVTTITLTDSKGKPVPEGYPVTFTSEPQFVTANDRTYTLDARPTDIAVNPRGRITLVTKADESLRAPTLFFSLKKFNEKSESATQYPIYPAQRVMRQFALYKTAGDLRSAKTFDGKPLFSGVGDESKYDLDSAAALMAQFPSMLGTVDKKAASQTGMASPGAGVAKDFEFALEKKAKGGAKKSTGSWFGDKVRDMTEFVGDVIEYIKIGFQETLRVVIKAIGPLLRVAIQIFDEVLSITIDGVSALVGTINDCVKSLTGIDLSELFGYGFDVAKIKQTQNVSFYPTSYEEIGCLIRSCCL
jgi:hypothetical protein